MVTLTVPLTGGLELTPPEELLLSHPALDRLGRVRQMGFAERAFPLAKHSRLEHSLGVLSLAQRLFASALEKSQELRTLPIEFIDRARQTLRFAALLHDVGHPPLSHATEYALSSTTANDAVWHHESVSTALIRGALSDCLRAANVEPEAVASLVEGGPTDANYFRDGGLDVSPLVHAIISCELDADRLDYVQRDSLYCGLPVVPTDLVDRYVNAFSAVVNNDGNVVAAVDASSASVVNELLNLRRALRLSCYFHPVAVGYEELLRIHAVRSGGVFTSDTESPWWRLDDHAFLEALSLEESDAARRIVTERPLELVATTTVPTATSADLRKDRDAGLLTTTRRCSTWLLRSDHLRCCRLQRTNTNPAWENTEDVTMLFSFRM